MADITVQIGRNKIKLYQTDAIVVGSGAAGLCAATRLREYGHDGVCVVTEDINAGTSRNAGSDKQTYYRLTMAGGEPDSVRRMAKTLYDGRSMDGDAALCEAALSAQCFYKLVELGVPFPRNRYGEFVGYKTDHDPLARGTSIGPYTSKKMAECLEKRVRELNIPIYDKMLAVKILTVNDKVKGLLCLELDAQNDAGARFVVFQCNNVIWATGGPAGIYRDSAYPHGQYGATGVALSTGAAGQNLTEWQYGLASTNPRWNVSGTYMQALPRFISTDADGGDEKDFLTDYYTDRGKMLGDIFLKGYQWPFDSRKAADGSSVIDLLVYEESRKNRRVFLDFRHNPGKADIDFKTLPEEAREYLQKAGAAFGTPYERLFRMNEPAVAFYKDRGVDLSKEPLEIALSAQHNNGGLAVDIWQRTGVSGLFAAGEAAGTHGVYRPGGSALNAGQAGATRAAMYISALGEKEFDGADSFVKSVGWQIEQAAGLAGECLCAHGESETLDAVWDNAVSRMSVYGAAIRRGDDIERVIAETKGDLDRFASRVRVKPADVARAYRLKDILTCQYVYLSAMLDYIKRGGKSRGGALYVKPGEGVRSFELDDNSENLIQETRYADEKYVFNWREARPIPDDDDFFENVWRSFRENQNIE